MSRTRQFAVNTGTGYALIVANIAFTVLSIPLALRYLGKEEFGLWALAQQIAGYLMLIDFGLSSAVSRLLANHKDHINGGPYGSLLITGAAVFILQGMMVFALGALFALFAPALFQVPPALADTFRNIITLLAALTGVTIALRSLTAPLWAFQRLDVSYGLGIISLVVGLASLWAAFYLGWGIYSFAIAGIPPLIVGTVVGFAVCQRAGFYPSRGNWGQPRWETFREMFAFGKDVMLLSVGSQLVNSSQIMILGRTAGLEAAATFAVGTKFYTLGSQLTGRLVESSAPALTEMFVQKDNNRLRHRFVDVFRTSLFLGTVGSIALVAANTLVVRWWTSGVVEWNGRWDFLLGALLLATTSSRCLVGLFGIAGNLRPVRNLYWVEGAVFIAIGIPTATRFGIPGLIGASLLVHLLITLTFSSVAARRVLGDNTSFNHLMLQAGLIVCVIFFVTQAFPQFSSSLGYGLLTGLVMVAGTISAWFLIMSPGARIQLVKRARSSICRMHT